jgi:hypothetical protein
MLINADPEFVFIEETCKTFSIKPEFAIGLYRHFRNHFKPAVLRSAEEILKEAWTKMQEQLAELEDGADVDIEQMMLDNGLDPKIRSDATKTRQFVKDSGLVQFQRGTPDRWVKRLTDGRTA